ncbi:MAG: SusD/RagB family nutrient-binding outer membrane lipoprotein [Chitinophagaceae bacterium]|nr:MAG: SusD/RagB family nutrient-binding outer membrane lipoprotein [Chitinophagaceae bacterium]
MKNKIIKVLGLCTATLLLGTGCTKDFDKLNTDPTAYNSETFEPNFILTSAQLSYTGSFDFSYETWRGNLIYASTLMQQLSTITGYWAGDKYLLNAGYTAAYWEKAYPDQVKPVSDLLKITADKPQFKNLYQIGRITRAMIMQRITDLYGDVPYFDAGYGFYTGNYFPAYDKQELIYQDIMKEYEEAAMALDPAGDKPSGDAFYGGDADQIEKWQRLAYSLLLRAGMRLTKVNPTLAQSTVAKVIGKTMTGVGDDAYLVHDTKGARATVNRNFQVLFGGPERDQVKWSAKVIDLLKSTNDPRLTKIAITNTVFNAPAYTQITGGNSSFAAQKGMPNGYDQSATPGLGITTAPGYTTLADYSQPSQLLQRLDAPTFILTFAETQLLLADAAQRWNIPGLGSAESLYNSGVTAAMTYMGPYSPDAVVSATDAAAYLTAHPYSAATGLEMINTQFYVHTATMFDFYESWSNWRRSGLPVLTPVNYPNNVTGGKVPRRLPYPLIEANTNPTNYQAASSTVPGGDNLSGRVWWDKE